MESNPKTNNKLRKFLVILDIVFIAVLSAFLTRPLGLIVFDGNSMTDGKFSTYPTVVAQAFPFWQIKNFGVSGQSTIEMLLDADQEIDPLTSFVGPKILIVWEGSSDLYHGAAVEPAYSRLVEYCRDRKQAGYTVIVLSLLPRTLDNHPNYESARTELNNLLRDDFPDSIGEYLYQGAQYADYFLDIAADSRIGYFGDQTDSRYFYDQVHMTEMGYAIIAQHVIASIHEIKLQPDAIYR